MNTETKLEIIKKAVNSYPDFPKPGILFRDIFSVLQKPEAFSLLREVLIDFAKNLNSKINCVVGLESRGFIIAPLIALELGIPFVPIRKKGKLPGDVKFVEYDLEYGKDKFEIQTHSLNENSKTLIVDDLLATGGSMQAACKLVESTGAQIVSCLIVMELLELNGRKKITAPIHTLIQF